MIERAVAVATHGRYLVDVPEGDGPWPVLLGFHGYAESADIARDRLRTIAGAEGWLCVAVQGLHRFYRGRGRSQDVVASWMTRQDRELAIADNLAYVAAVVEAVAREWRVDGRIVYSGFSQGVAMAFRAAASGRAGRVLAIGGDVPPELGPAALGRIPAVLIARGSRDSWYAAELLEADARRLRAAGVRVETATLDAAHEWTDAFSAAAAGFLDQWR